MASGRFTMWASGEPSFTEAMPRNAVGKFPPFLKSCWDSNRNEISEKLAGHDGCDCRLPPDLGGVRQYATNISRRPAITGEFALLIARVSARCVTETKAIVSNLNDMPANNAVNVFSGIVSAMPITGKMPRSVIDRPATPMKASGDATRTTVNALKAVAEPFTNSKNNRKPSCVAR